jgi:extracellular factor (EF) 3-hydroxypalmitic acid methyl ester biosynthesis protein
MAGSRSAVSELAPAAEPRLTGRVEHEGRPLALALTCASRLAMGVDFGSVRVADGAVFPWLDVEVDGGTVRLGRCRFAALAGDRRAAGRLLFLDDVYDCRSLVLDGRFTDLRGFFRNLPLVIAQRDRVRPEFERWVAALVYDLSVHRRFLDDQDRIIDEEPPDVAVAARAALVASEGGRLLAFLDQKDRELDALVAGFTKEEHERHGFYLRRMAWHFILGSDIHRRTNLKPRGYAGDAEMMRLIYEHRSAGHHAFDRLLHQHAVSKPSAEAVRARRGLIAGQLRDVDAALGHPALFRFLSVASGPAFELRDIYTSAADASRLECTLLDQDPQALEAARGSIAAVEAEHGPIRTTAVAESVRTMLRDRGLGERLGRFHYVYSMGLFDYLTPPVARVVLARLFDLLAPGGALVVGNFHVANRSRVYMDYWMDWPLYYRSEATFLALAEGLPARTTLDFDPTGCQMFLRLDRPT